MTSVGDVGVGPLGSYFGYEDSDLDSRRDFREGRSSSPARSALAECVARHTADEVTEAINAVCDEVGNQHDAFVAAAGRRVVENTE